MDTIRYVSKGVQEFDLNMPFNIIYISLYKSISYCLTRSMVKNFEYRLKNWTYDSCIIDVLNILICKIDIYIKYANNYDCIINTIDKLVSGNPQFKEFLLNVDLTYQTNMMTYNFFFNNPQVILLYTCIFCNRIQELMASPWTRVKEYMDLLSYLQLHTAKTHADQINIKQVLDGIKGLHLHVKQVCYQFLCRMRNQIN
jgi:hypothetical protein